MDPLLSSSFLVCLDITKIAMEICHTCKWVDTKINHFLAFFFKFDFFYDIVCNLTLFSKVVKRKLNRILSLQTIVLFNLVFYRNIASNYSSVRKAMWHNFLPIPCYVFTINFNDNYNGLGKYAHLMSKHRDSLVKTKMDISILFSCFVFMLTYS